MNPRRNHRATDDTDVPTSYAIGPGRRVRAAGPVIEVYADTGAIDRHCPNCGAEPLTFCRHSNGAERKIPCLQRALRGKS